jgi:tetratricopeptide (TPR) repeat protein
MSESELKNANFAFSNGDLDQCLVHTNNLLDDNRFDSEALLLRAKVYYKKQNFGEALNCINRILEKEKSNEIALNYKEMIMNIISFWNKDHYNP